MRKGECRRDDRHKAWNRVLHEEKARGAGEREIHVSDPSDLAFFEQRRGIGRGCIHFWIGSSRSSPDLDRREFTASRNSQKDSEANPILAANEGEGQTVGPQPPPGPPLGWQDPVGDRPEETAGPAVAKPKEPESVSVDPEKMLAVMAQTGIPEPKTPSVPGTKTAIDTTDETQSEIATAHQRAKRWQTRCYCTGPSTGLGISVMVLRLNLASRTEASLWIVSMSSICTL